MKKMIFNSKSEKDTQKLAKKIADRIDSYHVFCLYGELGTGKTTFVKAFANSLGVKERIISPTYVFIRKHGFEGGNFYHVDAYRIEDSEEDVESVSEVLNMPDSIVVVEWAEKINKILPQKRIDIKFSYNDKKDARKIEIIERKG